jgi:hypothetical protein
MDATHEVCCEVYVDEGVEWVRCWVIGTDGQERSLRMRTEGHPDEALEFVRHTLLVQLTCVVTGSTTRGVLWPIDGGRG